jgi:tetratricopeptide (TPR) repeat protein
MEQRPRRRPPGVRVDASAIRQARLAAGLSLSEVGGEELSKAGVHRIETGKVRPSARSLGLIAGRLGVPSERFLVQDEPEQRPGGQLEHELELTRLERLCVDGEYRAVVARASELLPGLGPGRAAAQVRLLVGHAHVQLYEPGAALVWLRDACRAFAALGDQWMSIECQGWEAAALAIEENRTAVDVAIDALSRCRQLDPVPTATESRILGHLAGIYLSMHDWERAVAAYEAALQAAGPIRDLAGLTKLYDGLSIAYQGLGDFRTATSYAERALSLSSLRANHLTLARIENNLGLLLLRSERWDEARAHLGRALQHCEQGEIEHGRSHVLLSLGQLAHATGDREQAHGFFRPAIELSARLGESMTQAIGQQWLAKVLAAMGRHEESDRAFEAALALLCNLGVRRRLAECHKDFAEALQARNELRPAFDHLQRAAEFWQTPVDAVSAFDWLDTDAAAN